MKILFPLLLMILAHQSIIAQDYLSGKQFPIEKECWLKEYWNSEEGILKLNIQDTVSLINDVGYYVRVRFRNIEGYILRSAIENTLDIEKIKAKREKAIADSLQLIKDQNTRIQNLKRKFGVKITQKILEGKIWLGMTDKMARESWGAPNDINRSVGSWGVHEQWVYGDTYLYFENGKLKSWQD